MRTTLKRGVGRGAHVGGNGQGNGHAVFPPTAVAAIRRYEQPPPARRVGLFGRFVLGFVLLAVAVAAGAGGGIYLWGHEKVTEIQAHTPDVVKAQKALDIPVAHEPAIALVIGQDHRAGGDVNRAPLSDTLMLMRADPVTNTISLLSFPRDLNVPIYCNDSAPYTHDRINAAYALCPNHATGTLLTIKHLTGLPINFLITVDFHGFKEVVDKLGGVWLDIDRRYYNPPGTGYATINLQPGYQRLTGGSALDFVRFRHTDSDLYRVARQQEFVRALREQIKQSFSPTKIPALVNVLAANIEVGEGGRKLQLGEIEKYAFFAYGLPPGHVFQDRIDGVQCQNECYATDQQIQAAVQQFTNPDVSSSKLANASALGKKLTPKTPPPSTVTVTVLNGNGVAGAASNGAYLLAQRGYRTLLPPNGLEPNAPTQSFHTKVYYDPTQAQAKAAATALAGLVEPADVVRLPSRSSAPRLHRLDPGSQLVVVLGQTFHGTMAPVVTTPTPVHVPAQVRADDGPGRQYLLPLAKKVPFRLEVPTVLEQSSYPDTQSGDIPVRLYDISGHNKAVRLVFRTGGGAYWGIEETNWLDAPALADRSFKHDLGGREFDLYYSGSRLQMVVLNANGASYWVVNSLTDELSNETMLAIAKGLKPLTGAK